MRLLSFTAVPLRALVLVCASTALFAWVLADGATAGWRPAIAPAVALAATLVGGLWLFREARVFVRAASKSPEARGMSRNASPAPGSGELQNPSLLTAWSVAGVAGIRVDDVLKAAREGRRPSPDADLRDISGFPVFAARTPALMPSDVRDSLDPGEHDPDDEGGDELWRALALLERALAPALADLSPRLRESVGAAAVKWLVPVEWPATREKILRKWIPQSPLKQLQLAPDAIEFVAVRDDTDALEIIDSLLSIRALPRQPSHHVVIGTQSHVGQRTVDRWSSTGLLFTSNTQGGSIPGEIAAVLVISRQANASDATTRSAVRLHRPVWGMHADSTDSSGRLQPSLLVSQVEEALAQAALGPSGIVAILSDADHRPSRSRELFAAVSDTFPALEPLTDVVPLGIATGFVSPLGGLLALCAAAETVRLTNEPALCVTCQAPHSRAVMIVSPTATARAPEESPP